MPTITTDDPRWVQPHSYNPLERTFLEVMKDERDLIFIRACAVISLGVFPLALALFLSPPWVVGYAGPLYIGFVFASFGGRFGLMLHAVGHRPIFKRQYAWMQSYIPFVLGPFLGHTPTSFAAHHMWMHHAENNMLGDGSSTLPYKRDSFAHFMHYFARFLVMGHVHLVRYLRLRGRNRTANRFLMGELAWFTLALVAWQVNWAAALVVFIIPMLMMRFLMMAGNWGQHAFVDLDDPDNAYANSHNLTNAKHNHMAYNDGYHIVHHLKPGMHWSEMAVYYENNHQDFADADAVVFSEVDDNLAVWFFLMTGNYDRLARGLVDFRGRTHDEKVAFLQARVRRTMGAMPAIFSLENEAHVEATKRKTAVTLEQALSAE